MGNGQVERANRTIKGLLKKKWPVHIDKLIHAYNTPHCSTEYTPFYLMFMREDGLSIEIILQTEEIKKEDWLEINLSKMVQINCEAMESLEEASKKRQIEYNKGVVEDLLGVGDRVRVKKVVLGRLKLEDLWTTEEWKIEGTHKDKNVYIIKRGDQVKTVNRQHL